MEKLLGQAQELVASLREATAKESKILNELETKANDTSKLKTKLEKQKADLDAREATLVAQEKPAVLLAEAKKIQAENKESLAAIDTAQKAFAKERADFNTKAAKHKSELGVARDLLAKELEVLKADRKQLDAARKTYKDDILNKLKVSV